VRHNLEIEGSAFRLRPVRLDDAAFIVELRSDPERARYLHRGAADTASQEQWLRTYFKTSTDCYFIVENRSTGAAEGTAGIYNLNAARRDAEWGRWILRRGSLAALESACLICRLAFETLRLDCIYCRTIVENASALAFHDSFGFERVRRLPRYFERDDRYLGARHPDARDLDAIESRLTRARWLTLREGVESKAARAAGWSVSAQAATV
jgi:RimJ/RimL family protein N-acetyltransferase